MKYTFTSVLFLLFGLISPAFAVQVNFSVEMTNEISLGNFDPANHQIVVAGGYHYPSCGPVLTDPDQDGIYTGSFNYPNETGVAYKFYRYESTEMVIPGTTICDTGANFELIPDPSCLVGIDRYIVIGISNDPITEPLVCWGGCSACGPIMGPYNVTFNLNMNEVTDPFTTPEVNGTFNGWCGACAVMSDPDMDGIWSVTIPLGPGTFEYKYAYDNWAGQETLIEGMSCTVSMGGFTNRVVTVTNSALVLDTVCWGSCQDCGVGPELYNVMFSVNMNEVAAPFTTPEVNGNFNGWCGGCAPMSDPDLDGIWELTIPLAPGTYEFKYAYDTWTGQETLAEGSPCTLTTGPFTNRIFTVNDADVDLGTACWGSCQDCGVLPSLYDVTFSLNMNEVAQPFTTPEVNGTFNGWCGGCAPMSDPDLDGIWTLTIPLEPGNYEYKFAYDNWTGQETLMEGMPCTVTANGFTNRSLVVTNSDLNLSTVCWASCTDCGNNPATYEVTFNLNMNEVAGPFTTPEVNGIFNGWCGNCAPMSDPDLDGIWSLTIPLADGNYIYKFSYDNWNGQETLIEGSPCTITADGFTNRSLVVAGADINLPTVCWGACDNCGDTEIYNVHFAVDMNEVAEPFTTPEVNGTFNGWCGGCAPMSDDDADGIWELNIPLAPGTYEFKYAYDSWTGQESLTPGLPCTITTDVFTNRVFTVSDSDVDLGDVCWASCDPCEQTPEVYNVTFIVDMSDYTEPFTTPEVNGTFNNWCGNCAPMSDSDADNIWEITIPLQAGNYEYKFSYDNWAGQEEFAGGESCTVTTDGFTNRFLTVSEETELDEVCFNACVICPSSVFEQEQIELSLYPNPVSGDVLNIQMNNSTFGLTIIKVFDATGKLISTHNFNFNGSPESLPVGNLSPGLYNLAVTMGNEIIQKSFIIE